MHPNDHLGQGIDRDDTMFYQSEHIASVLINIALFFPDLLVILTNVIEPVQIYIKLSRLLTRLLPTLTVIFL